MASFFRRKRSLIFKLILGIPTLWFLIVIFLSFQTAESDKSPHEKGPNIVKRHVGNSERKGVFEGFQNPINKINQIVQPFNPFVNKEVTNGKDVIDSNNPRGAAVDNRNPDDRIVHTDFDNSKNYRTSDSGPGENFKYLHLCGCIFVITFVINDYYCVAIYI